MNHLRLLDLLYARESLSNTITTIKTMETLPIPRRRLSECLKTLVGYGYVELNNENLKITAKGVNRLALYKAAIKSPIPCDLCSKVRHVNDIDMCEMCGSHFCLNCSGGDSASCLCKYCAN